MTDFSYQLYSSRKFGPLPDTLAMLAAAGYRQVEGYGALYGTLDEVGVARFKADLDANGLTMPTGHFGLDMLEREPERAIAIARGLGIKTIYCPFLMPDERPKDAAGWTAFGKRLAAAGAPIRAAGLGFGWHNHAFEFEPLADGAIPQALIFEAAPDLEWEADIAWIVRGKADPFEWIERHGSRISAVHVKDIAPEGDKADEDGWADVGDGVVPWDRLMTTLRRSSRAHTFIMEHDNPSDDQRFATRSIAKARTL